MGELLQLENETKSKPIMGLNAQDVDEELKKHAKHESNVNNKIDEVNRIVSSLKTQDVTKSEQANIKLSESMVAVLPRELLSKREFLEEQKNARIVFANSILKLNEQLEAAKVKSNSTDGEGMIDYLNIEDDLTEHQNYFQKLPTDQSISQTLDETICKIIHFASKNAASELNQKRQTIDNSISEISKIAKEKEKDLKGHLHRWKKASNLGPELEQVLGRIRNTSINTVNIHGLRRNIEDCNDNISLLDENASKFESFCEIVNDIQEFADPNSAQ